MKQQPHVLTCIWVCNVPHIAILLLDYMQQQDAARRGMYSW
jgi:hypothetical protein